MIDRNTPSDPRLRERRGDLVGRTALLFGVLVIAAFGAVAYLLLEVLPGAADPSPSGTLPATPTQASGRPSASPSAVATPSLSATATATVQGSPSAAPGTVGSALELLVDGEPVGTVTVEAPDFPGQVGGVAPAGNRRWAVLRVTYQATTELAYDAADWMLEDEAGRTYGRAGTDAEPALGSGSLEAGDEVSGFVTFQVPTRRDVVGIMLVREGSDPLVFLVP